MDKRIQTYQEFWPFFLEQHSKPLTKKLHFTGTLLGIFFSCLALILGQISLFLIGIGVGYAFAWYSHFFVEKNRPATFKYPFWSFISEFRMSWGVLRRHCERSEATPSKGRELTSDWD